MHSRIFFLQPNWFLNSILFSSKSLYNLLCISFSIILSKIESSKDIR